MSISLLRNDLALVRSWPLSCNRLYGGRGVPHRLFPMAGAKADLPPRLPWAELFTRVRGRRILRTSLFGDSQKFKFVSNGVLGSSRPEIATWHTKIVQMADAPHACYATSVTLRGGVLSPFFLRPTKEGWMGMRRIVLLLASMALAVIFGSGVALADSPTTKEDCKKGGYAKHGFKNQGQCTEAVKLPPPAPLAPDRIVFSTTRF